MADVTIGSLGLGTLKLSRVIDFSQTLHYLGFSLNQLLNLTASATNSDTMTQWNISVIPPAPSSDGSTFLTGISIQAPPQSIIGNPFGIILPDTSFSIMLDNDLSLANVRLARLESTPGKLSVNITIEVIPLLSNILSSFSLPSTQPTPTPSTFISGDILGDLSSLLPSSFNVSSIISSISNVTTTFANGISDLYKDLGALTNFIQNTIQNKAMLRLVDFKMGAFNLSDAFMFDYTWLNDTLSGLPANFSADSKHGWSSLNGTDHTHSRFLDLQELVSGFEIRIPLNMLFKFSGSIAQWGSEILSSLALRALEQSGSALSGLVP